MKLEILPDHATVSRPTGFQRCHLSWQCLQRVRQLQKGIRFPPRFALHRRAFVYFAVVAALSRSDGSLARASSSIRLWIEATPVETGQFGGMASVIATRSSDRIFSPVNIGSGIVLPVDYREWPPEKLHAVLAHEGSHVRQRDFYWQLLAGLYTALTWFSPLGWWLKRKLSELSEAISDRAGLEESRSRSAYAQLLLEFAALPRPTLTGVAMARSNNLSHRIDRLLNESSFKQAFTGSRRAFVAALIVPAVLAAATTLFRVQAAAAPGHADSSQVAMLSKDQMPSYSTVTGDPRQAADSSLPAQTRRHRAPPEAAPAPAAAPNPAPRACSPFRPCPPTALRLFQRSRPFLPLMSTSMCRPSSDHGLHARLRRTRLLL